MPFSIVRDDIARVQADCVVNAANTHLAPGGGVCGAIFAAAGHDEMRRACERLGGCPTGGAVVTPAFSLPATWCIHAVGPIWHGGGAGEDEALHACYRSIFARILELGAHSVVFPLISAGIYGFPTARALAIVREETARFLDAHPDIEVILVLFDRATVRAGNDLIAAIDEYIDDEYVDQSPFAHRRMRDLAREERWLEEAAPAAMAAPMPAGRAPRRGASGACGARGISHDRGLDDMLAHLDASFSQTLLALIDERGLTDATVYKRANISRQLFSKIRGNAAYRPTKQTAVALVMALELDLEEAQDLLGRAGLTLSRSSTFDVIVRFFIERGIYDLFQLNEALFYYDQPLVGSQ